VGLVAVAALAGAGAAWYHFLASPLARARVEDAASELKSFLASLAGLLVDTLSGLLSAAGRRAGGGGGGAGGGGFSLAGGGGGGGVLGGLASSARYVPLEDEELNYFQPLPEPSAAEAAAEMAAHPPLSSGGGGPGGVR
jgi:hypothetical protein